MSGHKLLCPFGFYLEAIPYPFNTAMTIHPSHVSLESNFPPRPKIWSSHHFRKTGESNEGDRGKTNKPNLEEYREVHLQLEGSYLPQRRDQMEP